MCQVSRWLSLLIDDLQQKVTSFTIKPAYFVPVQSDSELLMDEVMVATHGKKQLVGTRLLQGRKRMRWRTFKRPALKNVKPWTGLGKVAELPTIIPAGTGSHRPSASVLEHRFDNPLRQGDARQLYVVDRFPVSSGNTGQITIENILPTTSDTFKRTGRHRISW